MLNSFIRDVGCQILARSYRVLEIVQEHVFVCWRRVSFVNNVQDREEEGAGGSI